MPDAVDIESILSRLDPRLRKAVTLSSNILTPDMIPTPSYSLNRALNGGLLLGRQVLLWGSKSSAKSSLCLQTIGMAQKQGYTCAWIDAEMSYDEKWASKLGVDNSRLIYSEARTINTMVDVGTGLMGAGVDIIVVDSISALLPAIYFEKDSTELKQLENTKQIGAEARDMTNAVKMLNYANNQVKPTLLILISQARNNISAMYVSHQPTGGMATKFYSSTIIKLFSSESDNQAIKGKISVGDRLIEEKIGRVVRWDLQFSKTSPGFQGGEYDFYFRGDSIGIDRIADLFNLAESLGFVEKAGAWFTFFEERFQGRAKAIDFLKENPKKVEELIELCR